MKPYHPADLLRMERRFFHNVIKDFRPEHADFAPRPEMLTVAQHINHVAHTLDWFREGAFGAGFDLDFEKMAASYKQPLTLEQAVARLNEAYDRLIDLVDGLSEAEIMEPMADNAILGAAPKLVALTANGDHTAHHRGALSVYQRLLGMTPTMPYVD